MRTHVTVALSMVTGIAVGAVAVQRLHAQPKPAVYYVSEIDVTDPENYAKEFAPKAQATIRNAGGKFVVIGGVAGTGAKPIHALTGEPPKRVTIQAWESMDALNKWFYSAEYQDALKIGEKYAKFRRYAVEGQ
jgi:uncharacterized protein (DUF1330 family)